MNSTGGTCLWCRTRRLKCDGQSPCHACRRDGRHANCSYSWTLGPQIFALFQPEQDVSNTLSVRLDTIDASRRGHFAVVLQGTVFMTHTVAVKVMLGRAGDSARLLELCVREAWIWSQLDHVHVAQFVGVADSNTMLSGGFLARQLLIISAWMPDGDISQYLSRTPAANRLLLACDIAKGVEYLHGRKDLGGVVHGDLKGNNILVDTSAGRAVARVADFGLSQVMDDLRLRADTSTSQGGNHRWKAFERLYPNNHGLPFVETKTTMSDVFELARTILEMCTDRVPYHDIPNDYELCTLWLNHSRNPERPSTPWIDNALWDLLCQAWATPREKRPSIGTMRQSLQYHYEQRLQLSGGETPQDVLVRSLMQGAKIELEGLRLTFFPKSPTPPKPWNPNNTSIITKFRPKPHIPLIKLRKPLDMSDEDAQKLVRIFVTVLPFDRWKHLHVISTNDVHCDHWISFLLQGSPGFRLETLEVNGLPSSPVLGRLLRALPKLKNLRITATGALPFNPAHTLGPAVSGHSLRRLELRDMMAVDALNVMRMYAMHKVGHLALVSIGDEAIDYEAIDDEAETTSQSFPWLRKFIVDKWPSLTELSIHTNRLAEDETDDERDLYFMLRSLKELTCLTLRGGDEPDLRNVLGAYPNASYPDPPLGRLATLRLVDYDPVQVADFAESWRSRTKHKLKELYFNNNAVGDPQEPDYQLLKQEAAYQDILARSVAQIGIFEGDGLTWEWDGARSKNTVIWNCQDRAGRNGAPWPSERLHGVNPERPGWGYRKCKDSTE